MRARLIQLVVATTVLVVAAFLVPLAMLLRSVAAERAIGTATIEAQSLAPLTDTLDIPGLRLAVAQLNANRHNPPVTVFLPDGSVLGAPAARSAGVALAASGRSFTTAVPGGREVLVAVQGLPAGTAVIRAFVSDAAATHGLTRAWLVLGAVGLSLIGLGGLVADQLARSLVRPLTAAARAAHLLASGDLSVRATPGGPPEVREVSAGLNLLADRIGQLLAREREGVADLSHRLRTPLTVLRVDAESLRDPADVERISGDLDLLERTVNEIIHQVRRPAPVPGEQACDASDVIASRAAFWSILSAEQQRPMRVEVGERPVPVRVSPQELGTCLDNLLHNVFAHTPEGVPIEVRLGSRPGGGARLIVSDAGPGFAGAAADRGVSHRGSTGLGLDIVRRTAEASGGRLTIGRSPAGGASVIVDLGAPT